MNIKNKKMKDLIKEFHQDIIALQKDGHNVAKKYYAKVNREFCIETDKMISFIDGYDKVDFFGNRENYLFGVKLIYDKELNNIDGWAFEFEKYQEDLGG